MVAAAPPAGLSALALVSIREDVTVLMGVILQTLDLVIFAVRIVVISQFVLYLLLAFNVVDVRNKFIGTLWNFLSNILNPILNPIRRTLPPVGGMDFSYMVLIFGLWLVQSLLGSVPMAIY